MFSLRPTQLSFYVFAITALIFLLAGFCGVFFSFSMEMNGHGMTGCPFMGEAAICAMTVFYHISIWERMFVTTLQKGTGAFILFFLAGIAAFILRRYLFSIFEYAAQPFYKISRSWDFTSSIPTYLEFAFSQGILHSKAH